MARSGRGKRSVSGHVIAGMLGLVVIAWAVYLVVAFLAWVGAIHA